MDKVEQCERAMKRGFTLIEILVAVAIIGILGTVAVSNVMQHIDNARKTAAKESVDNLRNAVLNYSTSHKKMPNDLKDLIADNGDEGPAIEGGEGALEDPWGTEYKLEKKSAKKFVVISAGPDTNFGTEDDIRSDTVKSSKKN